MTYRKFAIQIVVAAMVAGSPASAERKSGQRPESGVDTSITVGSNLLERFDYIAGSAPVLINDLSVSLGIQGKIVIARGAQFRVERATPLKACTIDQDTYIDRFVGPRGGACLYDNDMDGTFDQASAESTLLTKKKLKTPAPYRVLDTATKPGANDFRHVLTYLGTANNVLRLSYREFLQDLARPAFTEELTFPLEAKYPQTITWRDTRITLLRNDSNGLTYRVEPVK